MEYPYTLTADTLSVLIDGHVYQQDRSNVNWDRVKAAMADPWSTDADLIALLQPVTAVGEALEGVHEVTLDGGHLFYGDEEIHSSLSERILDIVREGIDVGGWVKFAQNVYANPNRSSRDELYDFLEKSDLPITPDGCFIAYKVVKDDYRDIYSGRFDNSVGQTVVMPGGRKAVNPDREQTCSAGLHFCSRGYLKFYGTHAGNRVVLVKINPADVVSIPVDYDHAKGRTWRYEVVGEIDYEHAQTLIWQPVAADYDGYCWDEQDEQDEEDVWGTDRGEDDDLVTVTVTLPPVDVYESPPQQSDSARSAPMPSWSAVAEAFDNEPSIETSRLGTLTRSEFIRLRDDAGSCAELARHLNTPDGTVRSWGRQLGA